MRFPPRGRGQPLDMTQPQQEAQQIERAERAKSRMSTAAALMTATVFGVIVLGIVLYLVIR